MVAKIGYKSYLGFEDETTFGTAVQPADYLEYNSESLSLEITEQNIEAINGSRQYTKRVRLDRNAGGGIDFPLVPGSILKQMRHLSGDAGTISTLVAGAEFSWTFVFNDLNTNSSFTFQACRDTGDTSTTFNYTGSKINTADFTVDSGGVLNTALDIMSKDQVAADTISTASFQALNPYTFVDGTISVGNSTSVATVASVNNFSLNVANNLLENRSLGDATRDCIEPGMQDITGSVNMKYEDNIQLNRFLNNTRSYLKAEFDTGVTISTTNTHKVTFEMFNCYFNGTTPNIGAASEIIRHDLPFRSIFDAASSGSLKVTIVTNQATI
jgi:hypothetical protein